jgi:hypothetical protein
MRTNLNTNRIMGALLAVDLGLLALSGIPAFKQADEGWKWAVGGAAFIGFVVLSVALIGFAGVTLWRRRRSGGAVVVDRARRTALVGAVLLVAAMAADLAEFVIDPASSGEATKIVQASVDHHDAMVVCGYLLLASSIFVFPGVLLLARGLHKRGRRLGQVAVVLGFVGALGHAALATAYLAWAAMGSGAGAGEQAQMVEIVDRMSSSAALAPLAIGFIAFPFALVTTLGAQIRARVAPLWLLAPVVAAPVSAIALNETAGTGIALVLLIASTAVVAIRVARCARPAAGASEERPAVAATPAPIPS